MAELIGHKKYMRTRALRRHHRRRIIHNRENIIKNVWRNSLEGMQKLRGGKLAKRNLNCGCRGCRIRYERHSANLAAMRVERNAIY
mgnify:CR=1 FL=1